MNRNQEHGYRALGQIFPFVDKLLDKKIAFDQQIWDKMADRRAALSGGVPEPSGSWQNVMVEGVPKRGEEVLRRRYIEDGIPQTTGPQPRGMALLPSMWEHADNVTPESQPLDFNVDIKGIIDAVKSAEYAVNNSAAGQAISSAVDSINENADPRSLQDRVRTSIDRSLNPQDPNAYFGEDSDYDALGFDRWLLEKYQNADDFARKLRDNAERLNVPLGIPQGSPAERSLDKSMLTGGAGTMYDILKYLKQLVD
tara:strand:- start:399 stop:1160 length:762 start_codon:yes stop_codon:yes gene_type:complete